MGRLDQRTYRWAAECRDACAPYFSGRDLTLAISLCLAQIEHESDGDPDAANRIGAEGLVQALSGDIKGAVRQLSVQRQDRDPRAQLQVYARYLSQRLRATGSWATAAAAWATGLGGIQAAIRTRSDNGAGVPEHVAKQLARYIHPMLSSTWGEAAGWVAGWVEAGQPTERAEVVAEGRRYTVTLATAHTRGVRRIAVPYDGTYSNGDQRWAYSPSGASEGAVPPYLVRPAVRQALQAAGGAALVALGAALAAGKI